GTPAPARAPRAEWGRSRRGSRAPRRSSCGLRLQEALEDADAELSPDHRSDAERPFRLRREPIDPRQQQTLKGVGDLDLDDAVRRDPTLVFANDRTAIHEHADDLLDE